MNGRIGTSLVAALGTIGASAILADNESSSNSPKMGTFQKPLITRIIRLIVRLLFFISRCVPEIDQTIQRDAYSTVFDRGGVVSFWRRNPRNISFYNILISNQSFAILKFYVQFLLVLCWIHSLKRSSWKSVTRTTIFRSSQLTI